MKALLLSSVANSHCLSTISWKDYELKPSIDELLKSCNFENNFPYSDRLDFQVQFSSRRRDFGGKRGLICQMAADNQA